MSELTLELIIQLNKDAFPWAHISSQDHLGKVPFGHFGQRSRPTRVIQWLTAFRHVCDAIFHLNKDIRAMIDTQAIPRAEVLVNPYAHT